MDGYFHEQYWWWCFISFCWGEKERQEGINLPSIWYIVLLSCPFVNDNNIHPHLNLLCFFTYEFVPSPINFNGHRYFKNTDIYPPFNYKNNLWPCRLMIIIIDKCAFLNLPRQLTSQKNFLMNTTTTLKLPDCLMLLFVLTAYASFAHWEMWMSGKARKNFRANPPKKYFYRWKFRITSFPWIHSARS
jgi:hypothetical protein